MIAASEPQEFIPFGRQQILEHPGTIQIGIQEHSCHSENILSNRLSEVSITDSPKENESWILRETNDEATRCEEELYFKGKTVIWSIGPASTENRINKILKCCYTGESLVKEALWCNFHLSVPDITSTFLSGSHNKKDLPSEQKNLGKTNDDLKNCICILDANHIKFYTRKGKEYLTTLQFDVLKIWAMKYGLIFERALEKKENTDSIIPNGNFKMQQDSSLPSPKSFRVPFCGSTRSLHRTSLEQSVSQNQKSVLEMSERSSNCSTQYLNIPTALYGDVSPISPAVTVPDLETSELPVIFSLSHPLDEICPVVSKHENLSYISNPDIKIIFTSESPSLTMTYDRKSKLHSLWFIRKALSQESEICLHRESTLSRSSRCPNSFNNSGKACFSNSNNSSFNLQAANVSLPAFLNARTRKSLGLSHTYFPNIVNSPFSGSHEIARHSSPISSVSNILSPAFSHSYYSPSPRRTESLSSPYGSSSNCIESRMMTEDIEYAEPRPLYPQICFQHLWTESVSSDNSGGFPSSKEASKAFLSNDLIGQMYLCYLIKSRNILNLLKLKKNNDDSCIIFGETYFINAKDACELRTLNMIAVISLDGGIELYTGPMHVAKILISGVPSSVATSSYLSSSSAGPTFFNRTSLGSFPKRSSLLPQSVAHLSPVFNESLSQLSPVTSFESECNRKLTPNISNKTAQPASTPREGNLIALRDNVASRLSLEFSTGMLFRLELPSFGISPLVKSCLNVLQQVLPNELSLNLPIKWYCTRNAPGSHNIDVDEEWSIFYEVLFGLMGHDVKTLRGYEPDVKKSPVSKSKRAKKKRKSKKSGENDWNYLLESKHHALFEDYARNLLKFEIFQPDKDSINESRSESEIKIFETPNISNRSNFGGIYDSSDNSRTPMEKFRYSKLKGVNLKAIDKGNLESIDETPVQSKTHSGKGRIPSNRFQTSLNQSDSSKSLIEESSEKSEEEISINKNGVLYGCIPQILFSLHLLYEDMKLNELKKHYLPYLAKLLQQIAIDLNLEKYIHHYWLDFPGICTLSNNSKSNYFDFGAAAQNFQCFLDTPPNIFEHFYKMLFKREVDPYPFIYRVNSRTKDLIQLIALLAYGYDCPGFSMESVIKNVSCVKQEKISEKSKSPRARSHRPIAHRVVLLMAQLGITQDVMQTFPPGISLIIHEALYFCRDNPGFGWSKEAYKLSMRPDLASFCRQNAKEVGPTNDLIIPCTSNTCKNNTMRLNTDLEEDGMEDLSDMGVLKLRFSTDQRVLEARRMLQSAQPVRVTIQQRPDVSDHEFIQEQEKHLYAICTRTMALPVGRGMMSLRTATPVITEKLPIPTLCLTGRVPPTDKVVDMSHIEVASNINVWPLFHNGVAAGLRISPNAPEINSQWIIYNKPKTNNDELIEHAGFIMALGLNGHLSNLLDTSIYRYLIKFHEMTSVGLLLGIAASKRGTMDAYTVKILSLHIEAMLPPTGIEIDVDVVVEPAALISLGFLYQGTAHRHIAQVLLQEIGRPPGPEMDNSIDRESYSLAAGLALGLVVFGRGAKLSGLGDMGIADTLHHYMVAGPKRPYLGSQREKYRTPSFLIWEGDLVNTHVTGPGAALALGMLYFNTGNKAVAEWLKAPETQHLLEMVLPDALLLRTLAKGLILWEEIEPSEEWVLSHVPLFARSYCLMKPSPNVDKDIDYETMNQGYCNIVAGACMAIGLRFAGSAYEEAFETLLSFAKKFTSLLGKSIAELCGRSTIETCLNVITISLAMVMAGTGDIEVLRLCRYLRSRVGPSNSVVTYGSHLATHMAIGLLFLGGGVYTLSTSPDAIAALLCAFYPKWPIHSNDNRYHLQALRHLYVLAVEPRLLLPRDIDTRTLCYAHITCVYLDVPFYKGRIIKMRAPCLLPEFNLLKEVRIEDSRYWSIIFTKGKNWKDFTNVLSECSFIDVKQRAGCLSYLEDPQGFRSLLAQTLTSDDVTPWTIPVETIFGFSSDPVLVNFTQYFLESSETIKKKDPEEKIKKWLTYIAYYCLTKDKLSLLPIWVSLLQAGQNVFLGTSSIDIWQLKLMWAQALRSSGCSSTQSLIPPDMALSVRQYFHSLFDSWESDMYPLLHSYFTRNYEMMGSNQTKLASYLIFFDFPLLNDFNLIKDPKDVFQNSVAKNKPASTILKIVTLLEKFQQLRL